MFRHCAFLRRSPKKAMQLLPKFHKQEFQRNPTENGKPKSNYRGQCKPSVNKVMNSDIDLWLRKIYY